MIIHTVHFTAIDGTLKHMSTENFDKVCEWLIELFIYGISDIKVTAIKRKSF